jgi:hypothetical protein
MWSANATCLCRFTPALAMPISSLRRPIPPFSNLTWTTAFSPAYPLSCCTRTPFIRQASYLASLYPSVHLDLSLAITLIPHRAPDLVLEALELAPATKVLFGTDASRRPELFLFATRWWRESLAQALARLVDGGFADETRAVRWAELILAGNADRLYLSGGSQS